MSAKPAQKAGCSGSSDRTGGGLQQDTSGPQVGQQFQLGGAQCARFGLAGEPRSIKRRQEAISGFVGDVPEAGHERGRARVDERARERRDSVAGDAAARRTAGAQDHEIGVQLPGVDLGGGEDAVSRGIRRAGPSARNDPRGSSSRTTACVAKCTTCRSAAAARTAASVAAASVSRVTRAAARAWRWRSLRLARPAAVAARGPGATASAAPGRRRAARRPFVESARRMGPVNCSSAAAGT